MQHEDSPNVKSFLEKTKDLQRKVEFDLESNAAYFNQEESYKKELKTMEIPELQRLVLILEQLLRIRGAMHPDQTTLRPYRRMYALRTWINVLIDKKYRK